MKSASCTLSSVLPLSKSGNLDKLRLSYLMQQSPGFSCAREMLPGRCDTRMGDAAVGSCRASRSRPKRVHGPTSSRCDHRDSAPARRSPSAVACAVDRGQGRRLHKVLGRGSPLGPGWLYERPEPGGCRGRRAGRRRRCVSRPDDRAPGRWAPLQRNVASAKYPIRNRLRHGTKRGGASGVAPFCSSRNLARTRALAPL